MKKTILPLILAAVWISISEFVRNTFLIRSYWIDHYQKLGLIFPEQGINGAVWGIWSLSFSFVLFFLAKKFTLVETVLLGWVIGFLLMWLVIGNLGVLPYRILPLAVPLSMLEVYVAVFIVKKFSQ